MINLSVETDELHNLNIYRMTVTRTVLDGRAGVNGTHFLHYWHCGGGECQFCLPKLADWILRLVAEGEGGGGRLLEISELIACSDKNYP